MSLLRNHLIPRTFRADGLYPERVFTRTISFRVLCHAAIEQYFEDRVIEVATTASRACLEHRVLSRSATSLVAFSTVDFSAPPDTLSPPNENHASRWPEVVDIRERVRKAASVFIADVKNQNHGIREKNLMRMLLPVGLERSEIDPAVVTELDEYGKTRGQFAHSNVKNHVTHRPNPKHEWEKAKYLSAAIRSFDLAFDSLLIDCQR